MSSYDHEFMFKDLQGKRLIGDLYRRLFLYPILKKNITGKLVDIGAGLGDFCISYKNSVALDINKYALLGFKFSNPSVENSLIVLSITSKTTPSNKS